MCQRYHRCRCGTSHFLDYVATGKNEPAKLEQVVAGVAEGCVQAGAALIGGETAEMPGMYGEDDYDLAGFAVGVAEKSQIIDGSKGGRREMFFSDLLQVGFTQWLLSRPSCLCGLHRWGSPSQNWKVSNSKKSFLSRLVSMSRLFTTIKEELVNGIAHITGGGFIENVPRMFCSDLAAEIEETRFQCFRSSKLFENMVRSNTKKCLKSSIWVWDSCWQLALKM